jgi:hypothetical protein
MSIIRLGGRRNMRRGRFGGRLGQDTSDPFPAFADAAGETFAQAPTYGTITPYDYSTPGFAPSSPIAAGSYGSSAVPGSISPQDAMLLSSAITAAGKVGQQAIIGTPQLSYNAATGQYLATGGATIPSSLITGSALSSTLSTLFSPTVLLLGAGLLVVLMVSGKR